MSRKQIYINIEEIIKIKKRLIEINRMNFDNIVWLKNGVQIPEFTETRKVFKFMGLNNCDYIADGIYKCEFKEE